MPNEAAVDKATMLRGDGANYGQTGFATNTSLLRNDFRTDQGIGVPVFWDGRSWRTYANELVVPQATGAAYFEIVFQIGNVGYTAHREKLVPSIRKIWL